MSNIIVAFHRTIYDLLHPSLLSQPPIPSTCWNSGIVAESYETVLSLSRARIHSGAINANVSISRLPRRARRDTSMLYDGVYENACAIQSVCACVRGREGRSEYPPKGCPRVFAIAQVTFPRERLSHPCVLCVCGAYVAARYYRIIFGYFTGTQKREPRTCANSFTGTIVIRSREENKRKRTEAQSPRRVSLCFA